MTTSDCGSTEIWMDGDCTLCQASQRWASQRDSSRQLRFVDFRSAEAVSLPAPRHDLERWMHVRLEDGSVLSGYLAWCHILAALPRWRALVPILKSAPIAWLGARIYDFVARHRNWAR